MHINRLLAAARALMVAPFVCRHCYYASTQGVDTMAIKLLRARIVINELLDECEKAPSSPRMADLARQLTEL